MSLHSLTFFEAFYSSASLVSLLYKLCIIIISLTSILHNNLGYFSFPQYQDQDEQRLIFQWNVGGFFEEEEEELFTEIHQRHQSLSSFQSPSTREWEWGEIKWVSTMAAKYKANYQTIWFMNSWEHFCRLIRISTDKKEPSFALNKASMYQLGQGQWIRYATKGACSTTVWTWSSESSFMCLW